jgi:hypothetical protein
MDHATFDRIARMLGAATSRRAGIGAAAAAMIAGAASAGGIAAAGRRVSGEGPCGDGAQRDNVCTRNADCCTGVCMKNPAGKRKKGRCRCYHRGERCAANRNCCGSLTCVEGRCTGAIRETCLVCASGCAYATVADALAVSAPGAVIPIDAGTYDEDLTVSADVTLRACNGSAVTLRNASADTRTIVFDPAASPRPSLTIDGIIVTGQALGTSYGGISGIGDVTLSGTTAVTGCTAARGGGIELGGSSEPCVLTMNDSSEVASNTLESVDSYTAGGGGIYLDDGCSLIMNGSSKVRDNTVVGAAFGGGIAAAGASTVVMNDDSVVSGNTVVTVWGGGIWLEGGLPNATDVQLTMNGNAAIRGNAGKGGGGVYNTSNTVVMNDNSIIEGNTAPSDNGGGIKTDGPLTMNGASRIKDNLCPTCSGAGVIIDNGPLTMTGSASITGNIAQTTGGGVFLWDGVGMTAEATNSITGNSGSDGGGVRISNSSIYNVPAGVVTGNTPNDTCTGC